MARTEHAADPRGGASGPAALSGDPAAIRPQTAGGRLLHYATGLLVIALFGGALVILDRWLDRYSVEDIRAALGQVGVGQLATASAVAMVSYAVLTLYDALALRHLRRSLPFRWVAVTAFTSYAFSHSLGFASVVGASIRYRLYAPLGLTGFEVAQITLFVVTTFTIGLVVVVPIAMALDPASFAAVGVPEGMVTALGAAAVAALVAYVCAGFVLRRPVRVLRREIAFPRPGIAAAQVGLGLCDLVLAALVLYLSLPVSDTVTYLDTLVVFGLALVAGIISHVPGGLGVFDAIVLVGLSAKMPGSEIVAGLLVFRVIYYLAPLIAAGLLFGGIEAARARHRVAGLSRGAAALIGPAVPAGLAVCVFVTGAFLLLSHATPEETLPDPLHVVSLPLLEMSHFVGSVVGVLLILLSHAIQRRLHAAWVLSLPLLALGALAALLQGGAWHVAIVPGLILLALLPARGEFHRRGALLAQPFTTGWFVAVVVALGSALWLGLFSYKHVEFRDELWWEFAIHGDASRFLRASVAVGVVALAASVLHLIVEGSLGWRRPGRHSGGHGEPHGQRAADRRRQDLLG
ncbi:lysylphosphatidylglycerol synthase domain-containing protein [Arenibaculum pallidiluteum]|uniref:lysylphosphatidylglycerol synthase domain-containing protein n=1 Tax=Arenibaculum pallidiluteum TaxID=2812559 RepID=UPI001A971FA3|nr:lysylphosphatidylglycerol synthase domain-containing protein [Arenibaculum pallidiluteum]